MPSRLQHPQPIPQENRQPRLSIQLLYGLFFFWGTRMVMVSVCFFQWNILHGCKVGSGFRPVLSRCERRASARWAPPLGGGWPRAMLAPDASAGKYGTLPYPRRRVGSFAHGHRYRHCRRTDARIFDLRQRQISKKEIISFNIFEFVLQFAIQRGILTTERWCIPWQPKPQT